MEITITKDYEELGRTAAETIASVIHAKPDAVLALAVGATPMGPYRELAEMAGRGEVDVSHIHVFQLDAYLGIGIRDRRSLYGWMMRSFAEPLRLSADQVVRLTGDGEDPQGTCDEIEAKIREAGGIITVLREEEEEVRVP